MAAMVTLSDITSVHWQLALNGAGVAEGEADIHQSIRIILGTPKGSVPHRPDFGSDIGDYIDYPILEAIPHVVREAADAVAKWEPRCTLLKVVPIVNQEQLSVRVKWRLADGVERQTDSVVRG